MATCEKPVVTICDRMTRDPGCYCNDPYVFHRGLCILATECPQYKKNATVPAQKPPKCGRPRTTYMEFGSCVATCGKPDLTDCEMHHHPGCYCSKPYVYHRGQCILATECPKCPENEKYMDCGISERTCSSLTDIPSKCKKPGCYCSAPFVRHNGKCIKINKCP
ncbi:hypothetical protein L596_020679 [Steinernema carpocapsae]|uniref:TIL domain-containing protein n=1 Tax=Steinernema carpocapsae TaxID=34508 RepID=A0A4U5MUX4_STECR|nr:hypothetical protein L596_020679 [Steinernema carpocapsae]